MAKIVSLPLDCRQLWSSGVLGEQLHTTVMWCCVGRCVQCGGKYFNRYWKSLSMTRSRRGVLLSDRRANVSRLSRNIYLCAAATFLADTMVPRTCQLTLRRTHNNSTQHSRVRSDLKSFCSATGMFLWVLRQIVHGPS